jgi:hypothetical protein
MKSWCLPVCVGLTLTCAPGLGYAYSVTTYQAPGASRIEACSLATRSAESSTEEAVHGQLTNVSACQCDRKSSAKDPERWHCSVEATREH